MAVEPNTKHLVGFALVPLGAGIDVDDGVEHQVRNVDLDGHRVVLTNAAQPCEHLEPGLAAGVPPGHLLRVLGIVDDLVEAAVFAASVGRRQPVHAGQEVEVVHVELAAGSADDLKP